VCLFRAPSAAAGPSVVQPRQPSAPWGQGRPTDGSPQTGELVDRYLTDAAWRDIAETYLDRLGLAPRGDDLGVRWVAVRHADDHVHVVATLARQDGRRVFPRNDYWRAGEASREVEATYGLSVTAASDRTAAKRASYAETEKAARQGHVEPVRDSLRRSVRKRCAATVVFPDPGAASRKADGSLAAAATSCSSVSRASAGSTATAPLSGFGDGRRRRTHVLWRQLRCALGGLV